MLTSKKNSENNHKVWIDQTCLLHTIACHCLPIYVIFKLIEKCLLQVKPMFEWIYINIYISSGEK